MHLVIYFTTIGSKLDEKFQGNNNKFGSNGSITEEKYKFATAKSHHYVQLTRQEWTESVPFC